MTTLIANENYVKHYDPSKPEHRRWLLAVLDHVVAADPMALSRGPLRDLWLEPAAETAADLALAKSLIREFEGFHEDAYPDPLTGEAPWTVGWGFTYYADGRKVKQGDRLPREKADEELTAWVNRLRMSQAVRIPTWGLLSAPQRAALISFAFNLGENWYGSDGFATLTRVLRDGLWEEVPAALELYCNPGTAVEAGLRRRRQREGQVFASGLALQTAPDTLPAEPPKGATFPNPLPVLPYRQLDSATDQARRMCFSSACAMLLEFLRPGTLKGPNGDDQYLRTVRRFGDTTNPQAQLKALRHYGLTVDFSQHADFDLIERQIDAGIPVPLGYVHRGPVDRPTGAGHWCTCIGYTKTHLLVHDPLGEPDLLSGATLNHNGTKLAYTRQNFGRRWMVEPAGGGTYRYAPGKGWAIIAER